MTDPDDVAEFLDQWPETAERRSVTVHRSPPDGGGLMPCCDRTPFEVPRTDRITEDEALVTCIPPGQYKVSVFNNATTPDVERGARVTP